MEDEYKLKVSEFIPKLMWKVMKHASAVEQGFLFFRHRTIIKATFDQEECEKILDSMIINKDNVLTYLRRKYIPTYTEDGALFKDQACIQRVRILEDKSLLIHIAKSEPHKIITDTIHVMHLLEEHDFDFTNKVKYYINQVQIAYQDSLLYVEVLKEYDLKPPSSAIRYCRELLQKYGRLENIAKIKKRSVKRKFLRYHVKRGKLTWKELRQIINIKDFSERNVRLVCNEIRNNAKERGVEVDF